MIYSEQLGHDVYKAKSHDKMYMRLMEALTHVYQKYKPITLQSVRNYYLKTFNIHKFSSISKNFHESLDRLEEMSFVKSHKKNSSTRHFTINFNMFKRYLEDPEYHETKDNKYYRAHGKESVHKTKKTKKTVKPEEEEGDMEDKVEKKDKKQTRKNKKEQEEVIAETKKSKKAEEAEKKKKDKKKAKTEKEDKEEAEPEPEKEKKKRGGRKKKEDKADKEEEVVPVRREKKTKK